MKWIFIALLLVGCDEKIQYQYANTKITCYDKDWKVTELVHRNGSVIVNMYENGTTIACVVERE